MTDTNRPLRVFLCHSSADKPAVRELCQKLRAESWIKPWLDEEELYPGQDWNLEIEKAIEATDVIIVCLSKNSITKEGYVQREIRIALDYADYKPEGTLFIIPVRLEDCEPPRRLRVWQYADYFEGQREHGLPRLLASLKKRFDSLGLKIKEPAPKRRNKTTTKKVHAVKSKSSSAKETKKRTEKMIEEARAGTEQFSDELKKRNGSRIEEQRKLIPDTTQATQSKTPQNQFFLSNGMEFICVSKVIDKAKMEPENADNNDKPHPTTEVPYDYWILTYPVTNELFNSYATSKNVRHPVPDWEKKGKEPIRRVSLYMAIDYCKWLSESHKNEFPSGLILRLPTESEWKKALHLIGKTVFGAEWILSSTMGRPVISPSNSDFAKLLSSFFEPKHSIFGGMVLGEITSFRVVMVPPSPK